MRAMTTTGWSPLLNFSERRTDYQESQRGTSPAREIARGRFFLREGLIFRHNSSAEMKKIEYSNNWFTFWTGWRFNLTYDVCGYFDNRPVIDLGLIYFTFRFRLPFRNRWTDECDPPSYGIKIHGNILWAEMGGKGNLEGNRSWSWYLPIFHKEWVRTSILLIDDAWAHETPGHRMYFYKDKWANFKQTWHYSYTDKYDGEVIEATITVAEREWRPKWLTWTKLFAKVRRSIEVNFASEVGQRKGSWKGGTLGCGYDMKPGETALECIKRMEQERDL